MPSAARFDEDFYLRKDTKLFVDNYKLYEAWAEEYPYPTFETIPIPGCKFMDMYHDGLLTKDKIYDIGAILNGKVPGRESPEQKVIYSVGGMPVEDVAWGKQILKNAEERGIGQMLKFWDTPKLF